MVIVSCFPKQKTECERGLMVEDRVNNSHEDFMTFSKSITEPRSKICGTVVGEVPHGTVGFP